MQTLFFNEPGFAKEMVKAPKRQLLKWIGNKQRFAQRIVALFPDEFNTYYEPFLGSGAVLATLAKENSVGADNFLPLIEIWKTLVESPEEVKHWYKERWDFMMKRDRKGAYEAIKASYNSSPNPADLLFLCRSCYGGVVRFRQADGYMSTPCGIHRPISPGAFSKRVDEWYLRVKDVRFIHSGYQETMRKANKGDLVYCDPPYYHTQSIVYGAQSFSIENLFEAIDDCKSRGVFVALSIDGSKRSGKLKCSLPPTKNLFEREVFLDCGRSMLKRFQMNGLSLENEVVHDRLLLTY
ncbi:MAG: DNA adenine methylase [Sedimentisphaerales bacterium]|nr:DNA adenine methylase [Sedimentisphaerales bacterium]